MAARPAVSKLRDGIEKIRRETTSGRYFVDLKELKLLFGREQLIKAVKECSLPVHRQLNFADTILQKGIITFAILLSLRKEDSILNFIEHDDLDNSLPKTNARLSEIAPDVGDRFAEEVQWEFLPHYFQRDTHRRIQAKTILPILEEVALEDQKGAFANVSKVFIASSMQNLLPSEKSAVCIIRKQLKPRKNIEAGRKIFEKEKECLEILYKLHHPNIIELLCSYSIKDQHFLLFPCLDLDLRDFFRLEERFGEFTQNATFYNALHGLSSALENVHNLRLTNEENNVELARIGYHHDICPRNILVNQHTFILTDFGLAAMKAEDENSQTEWKSGLGDYIAPESMAADFSHQKVGRKLDIWSFGCLITDVAAYMERGPAGIEEAHDSRLGPSSQPNWNNHYFFAGGSLRPKFQKWVEHVCESPKESGIQLLFGAAKRILLVNPDHRPNAEEVCRDMYFVSIKTLFETAQQRVLSYYQAIESQGESGPPLTDIWFEKERLNAWGVVLEISDSTSRTEAFDDALIISCSEKQNTFQEKLLELIKQFGQQEEPDSVLSHGSITPEVDEKWFLRRNDILRGLVESLWKPLPSRYRKRIDVVWKQMLTRTEDIRILKTREHATGEGHEEVSAMAAMKALHIALSKELDGAVDNMLVLSAENLKLERTTGPHKMGQYQGRANQTRQVLVESVAYTPAWDRQTPEEKVVKMALATLLNHTPKPYNFRVLNCLGFLDMGQQKGFAFLYQFPDNTAGEKHVIQTLLESIALSSPSLSEKVRLAQMIASSVYDLHRNGWLHKSISSQNVIFFRKDRAASMTSFDEPYLANFRHSRPDGEIWVSEGPGGHLEYQHPEYSAKRGDVRFKRTYDYYSLGLVLLEIGFWKPLEDFANRHQTGSPESFRRILLSKYVPKLGLSMGWIYQEAVRACLETETVNLEEEEEGEKLSRFCIEVLERLMAIVV